MDFAAQTKLLDANEYFNKQIKHVYVRYRNKIHSLRHYAYEPKGGNCYALSGWALMGMTAEDQLYRGQIDLPKRPGWNAQINYKHGWVEFCYEDEMYVFDSLERHVWPKDYWEEIFQPHHITFQKTQREILDLALNNENAFRVDDDMWQFKSRKDMKDFQFDSVDDGWLRSVLGRAQLRYDYGQATYFLGVLH